MRYDMTKWSTGSAFSREWDMISTPYIPIFSLDKQGNYHCAKHHKLTEVQETDCLNNCPMHIYATVRVQFSSVQFKFYWTEFVILSIQLICHTGGINFALRGHKMNLTVMHNVVCTERGETCNMTYIFVALATYVFWFCFFASVSDLKHLLTSIKKW